ncbi:VOC family protein [Saccharopolyspora sp. ASAGF58]|uniref:VOC family protein n=1 Tax=Saccharopolyspora sp. ASAGF58 TaxID=2719023 RepID=UPI001FF08A96|nr:VOC family protein [Saccharopolyspora sp. ASAGF58]
MPARPVVRGLRRADLISQDPIASAVFYRALLDWTPAPTGAGFDCWVGNRRCAAMRTPRGGERPGWRLVFAGMTQDGSLTGPDDAVALVVKGRAQHGPWAPGPRPGEPCWVELSTQALERADTFWADILGWSVLADQYLVGERPLASRTTRQPAGWGWLCYFAVKDVEAISSRAPKLGGKTIDRSDHPVLGTTAVVADPTGAAIGLAAVDTWG